MRILVTGANGFIGQALCRQLAQNTTFDVVAASRMPLRRLRRLGHFRIDTIDDLRDALSGFDTVVHLAARVHQVRETATDPLEAFRYINTLQTCRLANNAARAGVRRFIFLSSIKVNGEYTLIDRPFRIDDSPAPQDPYGISKAQAEVCLREISQRQGLEVVIIRPPLVYGAGVKANFETMMRTLYRGIPLPFGAIYNRRSLVALGNLTDLIATVIDHPAAANQTFFVSDGEDLSTTDLLRRTAKTLRVPARLIPVPAPLMQGALALLGRKDFAQRLLGSLQVDIRHTRERLSWHPPVRIDDALAEAAEAFLAKEAQT